MRCVMATLSLSIVLGICTWASAYTPQSPKVQELVRRGVRFIEENYQSRGGDNYDKLGGTCLTGLAVYKHTGNADHPLVAAAVAKCRQVCREGQRLFVRPGLPDFTDDNYSVGIAILFLCELDAKRHATEIGILLDALLRRQQAGGGWSYATYKTGDTSQTQYAVLALWMARRTNVAVPREIVERVCGWLLRTQDPGGAWGYQGNDPGRFGDRVRQREVRLSLAAAGLSSTYICAEMLGFVRGPQQQQQTRTRRIPAALREVGASREKRATVSEAIPDGLIHQSLRDGNQWFAQNYKIQSTVYQHYYMYALERYMSFREYAERSQDPEPVWYNEGVDYLADSQDGDGHWQSSQAGPIIDSAFAILFLLRSTQATIGKADLSGRVRGGKHLPSDVSQIAIDQAGQVVSTKERPLKDLLEMLEGLKASDIDTSIPEHLTLADDETERTAQRARLRRMATNGSYQARLTAVRTLGRDRDFANVPALISALTDPDPRVARAARDGLRFISRRVNGFGLGDSPSESESQRAQLQWRAWYRSVRPNMLDVR